MGLRILSVFICFGLGLAASAIAEVAVIVNPQNVEEWNPAQVRSIFLGKIKVFNNGLPIFPIDIEAGDTLRDEFRTKVLRKSEEDLNAYWMRMWSFSEGGPPEEVENPAIVVQLIADNKSAIGYVDIKHVNDSVKVIAVYK